ncbi:hypothetical protein [Aliikangiella sp. IMCC44359]|uniref:hypothetical protein n=1 Tax=Aliikangiella sp. IMCC44359 TaxID=3459125 RepID=UPI00403AB124
MSLLSANPSYFDDNFRKQIKPTALGFLRQLSGLSIFDIKGKDTSRTRVVTTLIHGNEPSGFIASHLWLLSDSQPETNIRLIICNPEAAKNKPIFSHRYIANSEDLNRYFSASISDSSEVAIRASQIMQAINEVKPEAIVDLHNTSGSSPAFAVAVNECEKTLALASLFTNKIILTGLSVGALMEQSFNAPIITLECGGASEIYSHQVATDGLYNYFTRANLFLGEEHNILVHRHPIRVELVADASVGFSHNRLPTTDITLRADVEQLNKDITPAGEFLGWYDVKQGLPLQAIDEQGNEQIHQLIETKNGCFFTRQTMQLFMVTTILEIATRDCLFYATVKYLNKR